jgi:hypothetical protein
MYRELADARYVIADGRPIKILNFNMTPLLAQEKVQGKGWMALRYCLFDAHARFHERVTGPFFR